MKLLLFNKPVNSIILLICLIPFQVFATTLKSDFPENNLVLMEEFFNKSHLKFIIQDVKSTLDDLSVKEANRLDTVTVDNGIASSNKKMKHVQKIRAIFLTQLQEVSSQYKAFDYLLKEEYGLCLQNLKSLSEFGYLKQEHIDPGYYWPVYRDTSFWKEYATGPLGGNLATYDKTKGVWWARKRAPVLYYSLSEIKNYASKIKRYNGFSLPLLRAEVYNLMQQYQTADSIYQSFFKAPDKTKEQFYLVGKYKLNAAEKKYVQIKLAQNNLDWGDYLYRRSHGMPESIEKENLKTAQIKYSDALKLFKGTHNSIDQKIKSIDAVLQKIDKMHQDAFGLTLTGFVINPFPVFKATVMSSGQSNQLPPGGGSWGHVPNPVILEIVLYSKMQLLKINRNMNYLGYSSGLVPVQRYSFLHSRAKEYSELAIQSELRFIQFKKEAEKQDFQIRQMVQEAQLANYSQNIAKLRQEIANTRIKKTDRQIKVIANKIQSLQKPDYSGVFTKMIKLAATATAAYFTGGASMAAFAGSMVSDWGSFMQGEMDQESKTASSISALVHQKQGVVLDRIKAEKEYLIAQLEKEIAQLRQDFIYDNINFMESKQLDRDLYYNLAKAMNKVKRSYLDAGIRMAYLAERALAFEMDQPEIEYIKFDYGRADLKNLMAGDFLLQDLMMMEYNRVLALKQRNHIKHVISLREQYPDEFANFADTGKLTFSTGLYEFDKHYPGTYLRRIKKVNVIVKGLPGTKGISGSLTNLGSFLVRSKDGTMATSTKTLLPTESDIKSAFTTLTGSVNTYMQVGGVRTYQLEPSRLVLSKYDITKDGAIFPSDDEVRDIFEGFGVAGLWELLFPLEINDIDMRQITDIQLAIYFDAYFDSELEEKLVGSTDTQTTGLLAQYENTIHNNNKPDRVAIFSLRHHFPDAFPSLKSSGNATFEILPSHFPQYYLHKKINKILIYASDESGKGLPQIKLELLRKQDNFASFKDAFKTLDTGLSADIKNLKAYPKTTQIPVLGTWDIKIGEKKMLENMGDILLIFIYEYTEKTKSV